MAIETLRPNAAGDETNIQWQNPAEGEHWDKVDEATPDEDATYVYDNDKTTFHRDLYNLPAHSVGSGTINHITVYARAKNLGTAIQATLKIAMKSTNAHEGDEITTTSTYTDYSKQWNTNPDTGSAWTWSEIDSLQIGVALRGGHTSYYLIARCTQVWVEVDYTAGAIEKTSSDVGSGLDALSQAQAILDGVDTGSGVDAVDSLQTPGAKSSSDAGSGVEGAPVQSAILAGSESGSGVEALVSRLLAAFDTGYGVEASSVETDGLFKELFAAELGEGSDSLAAKIETPTKGGGMKLWT